MIIGDLHASSVDQIKNINIKGRPFDSSRGGLWVFCEKISIQQIMENK